MWFCFVSLRASAPTQDLLASPREALRRLLAPRGYDLLGAREEEAPSQPPSGGGRGGGAAAGRDDVLDTLVKYRARDGSDEVGSYLPHGGVRPAH